MALFNQQQPQQQGPVMIVPEQGEEQQQYPMQVMQTQDRANLLHEIDPTEIVERVKHELMGERRNADGTWVKMPGMADICINDVGANQLATLILSVCSQNMILSNLTEDDIKMMAHENVETAMMMCRNNWHTYGFSRNAGKGEAYLIKQVIFNLTYGTLKEAQSEGIRKLLKGTITEVRQNSMQEKPQASLLNMIWKRR